MYSTNGGRRSIRCKSWNSTAHSRSWSNVLLTGAGAADTEWSCRCSSGTRLTDWTTWVPVSAMTMRSLVFTRTPRNTPLDHLDLSKARQLNSQGLAFQTHVGCVAHPCGRAGENWNNAQPTRPTTDFEIPRWFQIFCSRKSLRVLTSPVHRLDCTLVISVALALALGRCFRHNLVRPTILDSVTEGNNAWLLIWLQDDSLVSHEIQIGRRIFRRKWVRHTLCQHRQTPDAFFTLAVSNDEHCKCVGCSVFRFPKEPSVLGDSRCLFCLLRFVSTLRWTSKIPRPRTHAEHQLPDGRWETLCASTSAWEGKTGGATRFNSSASWTRPSSALVGTFSLTLIGPLSSTLTSMFVSALVTGLTDKTCEPFGTPWAEALPALVKFAWRPNTGARTLHFDQRSLSCALTAYLRWRNHLDSRAVAQSDCQLQQPCTAPLEVCAICP